MKKAWKITLLVSSGLLVVGGLAWGIQAWTPYNIVSIVTMNNALAAKIVYTAVGLAALVNLPALWGAGK